jgi:peptide deformylase
MALPRSLPVVAYLQAVQENAHGSRSLLNKRDFLTFGLYATVIAIGILAFSGFYKKNNNVLEILEYPDPTLGMVSSPIEQIDQNIIALSNDIITTLRYRTLVDFFTKRSIPRGLAAPQVGILKRLVVVGLRGEIKVMVNPEILEREGTYHDHDDCLSVRHDDNKIIKRSAYVKLRYTGLDNRERIITVRSRDAAFLEHEIDHLNGVLNIDY